MPVQPLWVPTRVPLSPQSLKDMTMSLIHALDYFRPASALLADPEEQVCKVAAFGVGGV